MFRVIALANAALAAGWQGVGLAHRGMRTHRRQAVPMMGWFDDLTDGLLGEASGIPDGGADDLRLESELADALAENRAADGFDGRALRDLIVQKWASSTTSTSRVPTTSARRRSISTSSRGRPTERRTGTRHHKAVLPRSAPL